MSKLPFLQFYPADYLVDTRVLTLSARGAWVDIICVLHGSSTRGTRKFPARGWSRIMGVPEADFLSALREIEDMKVGDVIRDSNGDVTLTCRRMMNESITRTQTRLRVKHHREKERNAERNASSNADVTRNKSEVISQKSEAKNNTAPVPVAAGEPTDCPFPPEVARKPDAKFRAESSEIPSALATPEFVAAWADWCAYKRERGQTLRSRTAKAQLGEMSGWGQSVAVAAIRKSIVNGWTGVFQPDAHGARGKPVEKLEARFDIF
jgi:uncharacterized protein YdaU (DUF1376 family)